MFSHQAVLFMPIQTFYKRYQFAPNECLERDLLGAFTRRQYTANTLLTGPNQPNDRLFFVEVGAVQGYYIDHAQTEVTFAFAAESEIIMSPINLFGSHAPQPGNYLRTLEPVQTLELFHTDMRRLQQAHHAFALLSLQLTEEAVGLREERARTLHNPNPLSRYYWFLERHRNLSGRLKISTIASYLGISRHTLSRLRSEMAHNGA